MFLALTAIFVAANPAQSPTAEFKKAFADRKGNIASAKADPAIVKCMDIVIQDLAKQFKDNSGEEQVDAAVRKFEIEIKGVNVGSTDYRSMGGAFSRTKGRLAVGVRMGGVSRLRVFDTASMKQIKLPSELDWVYGFDSRPTFLSWGMLTVDAPAIKEMGIRYAYRFHFLKDEGSNYSIAETQQGTWNLPGEHEDSHVEIHGDTVTLRTIEPPKSFIVSDAAGLFKTFKILVVEQWPQKTRMTGLNNDGVHFLDKWMGEAMKSPKDQMQREFAKLYGKKPRVLESHKFSIYEEEFYKLTLTFDKTYEFIVEPGFEYKVKSFKVVS